jgi:hypothetical protein
MTAGMMAERFEPTAIWKKGTVNFWGKMRRKEGEEARKSEVFGAE